MAALIFWKYMRASELKDVGELFSGNSCLVQMYKSNRTIKNSYPHVTNHSLI